QKAMQYTDAVLSVTPAGAPIFFFNIPGAASADALLPPASVLTPLPGLIFRSPTARQIPICRADRGFFQNVADVSIAYQIFGTRMFFTTQRILKA
ncbi:MAG: hypothetical protein IJN23_00780, partial [Akkermansia sp.]|nr:hypothetical protein [Akkermansia sp.]